MPIEIVGVYDEDAEIKTTSTEGKRRPRQDFADPTFKRLSF
jgi:hypothetical protein